MAPVRALRRMKLPIPISRPYAPSWHPSDAIAPPSNESQTASVHEIAVLADHLHSLGQQLGSRGGHR